MHDKQKVTAMMRFPMLQRHHLAIAESQDIGEFRRQAVDFAHSLGFGTVSAVAIVEQSPSAFEFYGVDNAPPAFLATYHSESVFTCDPVMQHCKRSSIPIVWNQNTYVERGVGGIWEQQAAFGYRTGIAFGLHLPEGRHFAFGVDADRPLPRSARQLTWLVAELQLFAVHAQDAALRTLVPIDSDYFRPSLTVREIEALKWTMDGKTASEIGYELSISERTVVFHLRNAMRKLKCNSKYQAVLAAIRLRLLS